MRQNYLTTDDMYPLNIFDYKNEKLILVEPVGEELTFLNVDYTEDMDFVYDDSPVFGKCRWKVDILPPDNFSSTFTTNRDIVYYKYTYQEHSEGLSEAEITERQEQLGYFFDEINYSDKDEDDFGGIF